jgi:hypothetical protein
MHHNSEQRELTLHIGSLQYALDKPTLLDKLSLVVRESFHIMDISEELPLSEDLMLEEVRVGPWSQTVESHLTWKKQLLEDITTKQIRANRWKDTQRVEQEFRDANGPVNYTLENSTKRVFEEIPPGHSDRILHPWPHHLNQCPTPVGRRETDRIGPRRIYDNHLLPTTSSTRNVETNHRRSHDQSDTTEGPLTEKLRMDGA